MRCKPRDYGRVEVVRVHIDRLDHADKAVWGVSMTYADGGRAYTRAHRVSIGDEANSVFRPGNRQPKAWLELRGVTVERWVFTDGEVTVSIG